MSCYFQDCLKGNFTRIEGSEMLGNLSLVDCTNDCFDTILEYIKKILSNIPTNQPLYLPFYDITLNSNEYTLSFFALPAFKTIDPRFRKTIPIIPSSMSSSNIPQDSFFGSPDFIVSSLRQLATTNPYNTILFVIRIDISSNIE